MKSDASLTLGEPFSVEATPVDQVIFNDLPASRAAKSDRYLN
jgi:hypothetical protein